MFVRHSRFLLPIFMASRPALLARVPPQRKALHCRAPSLAPIPLCKNGTEGEGGRGVDGVGNGTAESTAGFRTHIPQPSRPKGSQSLACWPFSFAPVAVAIPIWFSDGTDQGSQERLPNGFAPSPAPSPARRVGVYGHPSAILPSPWGIVPSQGHGNERRGVVRTTRRPHVAGAERWRVRPPRGFFSASVRRELTAPAFPPTPQPRARQRRKRIKKVRKGDMGRKGRRGGGANTPPRPPLRQSAYIPIMILSRRQKKGKRNPTLAPCRSIRLVV